MNNEGIYDMADTITDSILNSHWCKAFINYFIFKTGIDTFL